MNNILTAMNRNTMTVTMIQGKSVNQVKVICDVRLLPGYGTAYLKEITDRLAEKWDAECRILSFSEGYESQPEGGLIGCLEEATKMELGEDGKRAEVLPFISMGSSDGRFLVPMKAKVYGYSPVLSWDMTFDQAVSWFTASMKRFTGNRCCSDAGYLKMRSAGRSAAGFTNENEIEKKEGEHYGRQKKCSG